jgi:hypothetical protein
MTESSRAPEGTRKIEWVFDPPPSGEAYPPEFARLVWDWLAVQRGSSFGPPARPQLANLGDIGDLLVAYPGSQFVGIAAFREAAD